MTARIVPNAREARAFTDEYSRRFRAMVPLPQGREQAKSPALEPVLDRPAAAGHNRLGDAPHAQELSGWADTGRS